MLAVNTTQNYVLVFMLHKAIQKNKNDGIFFPLVLDGRK
jgi:hypothetical protein